MPQDPRDMFFAAGALLRNYCTARGMRNLSFVAAAVFLLSAGAAWLLHQDSAFDLGSLGALFYGLALAAQVFLSRTAGLVAWLRAQPEARLFADESQRALVVEEVAQSSAGLRRSAIAAVLAFIAAVALAVTLYEVGLLGGLAGFLPCWTLLGCWLPLVLPVPAVLAYPLLWRRRALRRLRERLAALGIAVCLKCGYDLRGNVSGRCPECGEVIKSEQP